MSDQPREHEWTMFHKLECCKVCGVVRRRDGQNKPCKGPVKVTLRRGDYGEPLIDYEEPE